MTTAAAPPANDVTRSYVTLSFLQWLPVGLSIVPLVLLMACCAAWCGGTSCRISKRVTWSA